MRRRHYADTSVAIPLVLASHDRHEHVNRLVGSRRLHLSGHAVVETFAVLTRLPGDARLDAADALALLAERFARVVDADVVEPFAAIGALAEVGIVGGAVYDGLVALAASATANSVLLSRDLRASATYARLGVRVELLADATG